MIRDDEIVINLGRFQYERIENVKREIVLKSSLVCVGIQIVGFLKQQSA